jgi:polysaccharide pyruvyl transferase WcaK-like protein
MKTKPLVISIIGSYYLKNRGDELLLKGTIKLFQLLFTDRTVKFNIYLMKPDEEACFFSNEERRNLHIFSSVITFIEPMRRSLYLLAWSCLYRIFPSNQLLALLPRNDRKKVLALLQSDFIVFRSIDQISDIFSSNLFLNSYIQATFGYNLKKQQFLLHSQTIFFTRNHNLLVKLAMKFSIILLSKEVNITLRDKFSEEWFVENKVRYFSIIPPPSIIMTPEIKGKHYTKEKQKPKKILIFPRIRFLESGDYIELVEGLISKYPTSEIFLAGQSCITEANDDDYVVISNILHRINANQVNRIKVFDITNKSLLDILKFIMDFDCVVSLRAIMAVSALSSGIPTIMVDPYGGKNIGLAKLFGFEKFACSIESFNPSLVIGWIEDILENEEQYHKFLQGKSEELYNEVQTETRRLIQASCEHQ